MSDGVNSPTWESDCGTVKLWLGDCLKVMQSWPDGAVDAVVTDPPYGVDYKGKTTKHSRQVGGKYNNGDDELIGPRMVCRWMGRAVVYPGSRICHDYPKPAEMGFVYCPSGAGLGRWGFITGHPILYYGNCPYLAAGLGHRPNGFVSFDTQKPNGHPCPKPVQWMKFAVEKASTKEGQTIADPFMGSGTTGVAAVRLGRQFWGVEIDPEYFEIAKQRIQDELRKVEFLEPHRVKDRQAALFGDGD